MKLVNNINGDYMHFTISFALVNIPVEIKPIIKNNDKSFNYLHDKCLNRVKYVKFCPKCKKMLESKDLVKGYEYKKGEYVVFSDSELRALKPLRDKTIEIISFVKPSEIDPWYYEKRYVLSSSSSKSFNLLKMALSKTKTVGVCRTTLGTKFYYGLLECINNYLIFSTIYFENEINLSDEPLKSNVAKRELDLAIKIIENMTDKFEPLEYVDEYNEAISKAINTKLKGKKIKLKTASTKDSGINDLMKALEESLK